MTAIAVGSLVGLLALTKPEPAVAGVVAVTALLFMRRRAGIAQGRELLAVVIPALAIPAAVYGLFLSAVSPERLLFENLYPRDFLEGNPLVEVRIPLTIESFVKLGEKLALYAAGVGALIVLARLLARGGRLRTMLLAGTGVAVCLAVAASLARPEALRHGLEYAYGWIPAGVVIVAAFLAWRVWRRGDALTPERQLELAGLVALMVLAGASYPGFFPHAPYEQIAAYSMPFAAIFIVALHFRAVPGGSYAYGLGALWLVFLAAAGVGLTVKDARFDGATVSGPGGAIAETAPEAALYQSALDWIARETRPGDSIFVAPLMPGLYSLSARENPTEQLSLLPGSVAAGAKEEALIETLREANVELVVTDDRLWHVYGRGAFGVSFNKPVAAWIKRNFEVIAELRSGPWHSFEGDIPPRQLTIWKKRA